MISPHIWNSFGLQYLSNPHF